MIASGWQTAAPQADYFEAVTVTDSACLQLLESSFGISNLRRPTYSAFERARTGEVYPVAERLSQSRLFEFRRLAHPVRATVSQT